MRVAFGVLKPFLFAQLDEKGYSTAVDLDDDLNLDDLMMNNNARANGIIDLKNLCASCKYE